VVGSDVAEILDIRTEARTDRLELRSNCDLRAELCVLADDELAAELTASSAAIRVLAADDLRVLAADEIRVIAAVDMRSPAGVHAVDATKGEIGTSATADCSFSRYACVGGLHRGGSGPQHRIAKEQFVRSTRRRRVVVA